MKYAIFKIPGRKFSVISLLIGIISISFLLPNMIGFERLLSIDLLSGKIFVLFFLFLLPVIAAFSPYAPTLTVSDKGIELRILFIKNLGWKLDWKSIDEIILIVGAMNGHRISMQSPSTRKILTLIVWELHETNISIITNTVKQPLLQTKPIEPVEHSLYKAIKYFYPEIREASSREASELTNLDLDLGKEAGYFCYGAAGIAVVAILTTVLNKSRVLDTGYLLEVSLIAALIAGALCIKILGENAKFSAKIVVAMIFAGCTFWGIRSSFITATYYFGEREIVEYQMTQKYHDHQLWTLRENEKLTIEIYADPENFTYQDISTTKEISLRRGPFNIVTVPFTETYGFILVPKRRRS